MKTEIESPIISQLEAKQISEEIALCLGKGVSSWQILKTLRFIRQAAEEGKSFSMEKHFLPLCDKDGSPDKV